MAVINGENMVLGRLASAVAERLLNGETISLVNADKVVVSGRPEFAIYRYKRKISLRNKGNPFRGPKFPKQPQMVVKKSIEGMLPSMKYYRGKQALKRLKCFVGLPEEFSKSKLETIDSAKNSLKSKFTSMADICKALGARI